MIEAVVGKHSVGIHRGGSYWCAGCGDIKVPCEHFPPVMQAAPEMLKALQAIEDRCGASGNSKHDRLVWTIAHKAIELAKSKSQ